MIKFYTLIVAFGLCVTIANAQHPRSPLLHHPDLVSSFYTLMGKEHFWLPDTGYFLLMKRLVNVIDSADKWALNPDDYHSAMLHLLSERSFYEEDTAAARYCEMIFTDAAISFFKDLYEGSNNRAGYDELSAKCTEMDKRIILNRLVALYNGECLEDVICSLEPASGDYLILKSAYQNQTAQHVSYKVQLKHALDYLRWINHFRFSRYIIVNIPAADLRYYVDDTVALTMKVVAGKVSAQTPRFAAYCNKVVLYPYWNVPNSIAVNELLPLFKKTPGLLTAMNMQVLDKKGNVLDAARLHWSSLSRTNFPYRLRQSTGCDNALGIMKFNLTNPFNVYMHDTNNKQAFQFSSRFYSHGCIRIEKPLELANLILPVPVDSSFVMSCLKDEKPVELNVINAVPVFAIYSTAAVNDDKQVIYYKDVYKLFEEKL